MKCEEFYAQLSEGWSKCPNLFLRWMTRKLFPTTPTEMMHCSFMKPFIPTYEKSWKLFTVSKYYFVDIIFPFATLSSPVLEQF